MTPSRHSRNPVDGKQIKTGWCSCNRAPVKQRPRFRPVLEPVEDRCLLSVYNVPIDLGTLGASNLQSGATAINNTTGQVVGSSQILAGDTNATHPFLWTAGGSDGVPSNPQMKDLGSLVAGGYGWATDCNDSGQVVGWEDSGQFSASGNPIKHAFLWTAGGTDGVPSNPQMKDLQITWGGLNYLAINNSGVVVGNEATSAGPYHAFVWDQTHGVRDLNDLVPSNLGVELRFAADINTQGQIVANGWNIGGTGHAYLLSDNNADGDFKDLNEVTDLGRLQKASDATALAINDVGQVAGGSGGNAFRWEKGVMKNLGQIRGQMTEPTGINHSGYVVGGSIIPSAWVWTGSGNIKDLSSLIPKGSGWSFSGAWGINDAGKIVGYGTPPSGGPTHAFLVAPTTAPAAASTTSADSITDANALSLAPLEPIVGDDLVRWLPGGIPGKKINAAWRGVTWLPSAHNAAFAQQGSGFVESIMVGPEIRARG